MGQKYTRHDLEGVAEFVEGTFVSNVDLLFGVLFNGVHIGNIKLGPMDFERSVSDISYIIRMKDYRGKDLASDVIGAVVEIAFNNVGLEKITAGRYSNNIGWVKSLEKNGFVAELKVTNTNVLF